MTRARFSHLLICRGYLKSEGRYFNMASSVSSQRRTPMLRPNSEANTKKINEIKHDMLQMYHNAISSVMPGKLVSRVITKSSQNKYIINGKEYILDKNVYVVGFGKAILDMAIQVNALLGEHVVRGILSVPEGALQPPEIQYVRERNVEIREGAAGNLPDKKAECSAREISNLADSIGEGSILLVLISGGGSALLPSPINGITVEETAHLVFKLQSKGASIYEVNSVRKRICSLKGGGLAIQAYPAQVISFILSDVIGDSLDFIASGPTVENIDPPNLALDIIKRYGLQEEVPKNIIESLQVQDNTYHFPQENVHNILIGSNKTALQSVEEDSIKSKYFPVILSDKIDISVAELSEWYALFCNAFYKAKKKNEIDELKYFLEEAVDKYNFSSSMVSALLDYTKIFNDDMKGLCIIAGGEPTVTVKNTGCNKGGRSQELALRFSVKMQEITAGESWDGLVCILMAAGTDGIDGPTDAAGAFGYAQQISEVHAKGLIPEKFIEQSNSYGYFSQIPNDFIKIGHTGTNVMDLHILVIQNLDRIH